MHRVPARVCALLSLSLALSSACGPGWPGVPPDPAPECAIAADCPAAPGPCELAACVAGACDVTLRDAGAACDDGVFCTEGEVCDERGICGGGGSPCREYAPGIPRCNEVERQCEICTDGRPLVNGECRCPFWNCIARGGATYCSETDQSEENQTGCYYDGLTVDDLTPLLAAKRD